MIREMQRSRRALVTRPAAMAVSVIAVALCLLAASPCAAQSDAKKAAPAQALRFEELDPVAIAPGTPRDIAAVGDCVYVADGSGGLTILDVADPARIRVAGRYAPGDAGDEVLGEKHVIETPDDAVAVSVSGRFAFLLTRSMGPDPVRSRVLRIDVSNPAKPDLADAYVFGGDVKGIAAIDGTRVCVARDQHPFLGQSAFCVLDFHEAGSPRIAGELTASGEDRFAPCAVAVKGSVAILASCRDGLRTVDLRNPESPGILGHYYDRDLNSMGCQNVKVAGNVAYLADFNGGLYLVDNSDPKAPKGIFRYAMDEARAVDVTGSTAFVADGEHGIRAIGVGDPAEPRLLGVWRAKNCDITAIAAAHDSRGGIVLCAVDEGGLRAFRVTSAASRALALPPSGMGR